MPARWLILSLALSATVALSLACGDEEERDTDPTAGPAPTVEAEIEVGDFYFGPVAIEASLGDEITVELTNKGVADHTFSISEFLVDEQLTDGEDGSVTFTPNEPGEFTFFCSIHPDQMHGSLRITRPGDAPGGTESPAPDPGGGNGGFGY